MKVYGKYSRYRRIIESFDSSAVELSDESDRSEDEGYLNDCLASDDTTKVTTAGQATRQLAISKAQFDHENSIEVVDTTSEELRDSKRESTALEMLDFLDKPKKKKRKTNYTKHNPATSEENTIASKITDDFQKTIDSVNGILLSLKDPEEATKEKLHEQYVDGVEEERQGSQKTYGRTRTILFRESQADELDSDPESEFPSINNDVKREDDATTYHFNQLRTMGENLKYQDDIEFIMNSERPLKLHDIVSRLLNLALSMITNDGLCAYIIKYHHKNVWKWCFSKTDCKDQTLSLLQGFIACTIPVDVNDVLWRTIDMENFILPLTRQYSVKQKIKGTRFTQMNYQDFLKKTSGRPGLYYALRLLEKKLATTTEISENVLLRLADLLQEYEDNPETLEDLSSLVEKCLLPIFRMENLGAYTKILSRLLEVVNRYPNNAHVIKSLIKLTNEKCILSRLTDAKSVALLHSSLSYINNSVVVFHQIEETHITNMVILYLGLCLNLLTTSHSPSFQISTTISRSMYHIFQHIFNSKEKKLLFIKSMFLLVFAYIHHITKQALSKREREFLRVSLSSFSLEMKMCNQSIWCRVQNVLHSI